MTLFCDGRVILLAVPTSLRINTLERQPGLLGTSIGETTRTYASAVGLGKGLSFSCMKCNRSLKLSTRTDFQRGFPRIWLEWAHTMTRSRVLGGQFHIFIMLYRKTQLVHLTLLDFWGLRHTRRQDRKVTCRLILWILCNGQVSNYQNTYLIQRLRETNKQKNNNELFIPESQCDCFLYPSEIMG